MLYDFVYDELVWVSSSPDGCKRGWQEQDHYSVLGLKAKASANEAALLEDAYRDANSMGGCGTVATHRERS